MHTLRHFLGLIIFGAAFLVGHFMVLFARKWARSLTPASGSAEPLGKFFLYSGRTIETVAAIAGFIEGVAVMVLVL